MPTQEIIIARHGDYTLSPGPNGHIEALTEKGILSSQELGMHIREQVADQWEWVVGFSTRALRTKESLAHMLPAWETIHIPTYELPLDGKYKDVRDHEIQPAVSIIKSMSESARLVVICTNGQYVSAIAKFLGRYTKILVGEGWRGFREWMDGLLGKWKHIEWTRKVADGTEGFHCPMEEHEFGAVLDSTTLDKSIQSKVGWYLEDAIARYNLECAGYFKNISLWKWKGEYEDVYTYVPKIVFHSQWHFSIVLPTRQEYMNELIRLESYGWAIEWKKFIHPLEWLSNRERLI